MRRARSRRDVALARYPASRASFSSVTRMRLYRSQCRSRSIRRLITCTTATATADIQMMVMTAAALVGMRVRPARIVNGMAEVQPAVPRGCCTSATTSHDARLSESRRRPANLHPVDGHRTS
jgi:hypothetical protein